MTTTRIASQLNYVQVFTDPVAGVVTVPAYPATVDIPTANIGSVLAQALAIYAPNPLKNPDAPFAPNNVSNLAQQWLVTVF